MKDVQVTRHNFHSFFDELQAELEKEGVLIVTTQAAKIGKWGMARLWRAWMGTTATFMAQNGVTMPLMITDGETWGKRPFNADDAHEAFTAQWLGVDSEGNRLSWSKKGRDGHRPATQGERFNALRSHSEWATERGILLLNPRGSEYSRIESEQNE